LIEILELLGIPLLSNSSKIALVKISARLFDPIWGELELAFGAFIILSPFRKYDPRPAFNEISTLSVL